MGGFAKLSVETQVKKRQVRSMFKGKRRRKTAKCFCVLLFVGVFFKGAGGGGGMDTGVI